MAAQLPPLPSPRSRQTEPPRVGLGRLKKLGRFYFAALAGAPLCLLLLQLAAGLGPHRQVILRAQTTVRHSCACAIAQRRAGGRNRGSGSRGRGAAEAGGQGEARLQGVHDAAPPQRQPLQQRLRRLVPCPHDTPPVRLSADPGHTPTAQHSEAALFANWTHARRTDAEVAPPWAVAVDEHTAVPRVDALRRSVGDGVSEQQNILRTNDSTELEA